MNYQSDHSKISLFWVLIDVSTSVYVYVLMDRWTGDPVLVPSSQLWSGLFWFLASPTDYKHCSYLEDTL